MFNILLFAILGTEIPLESAKGMSDGTWNRTFPC